MLVWWLYYRYILNNKKKLNLEIQTKYTILNIQVYIFQIHTFLAALFL